MSDSSTALAGTLAGLPSLVASLSLASSIRNNPFNAYLRAYELDAQVI
jgi:hypothetical protein